MDIRLLIIGLFLINISFKLAAKPIESPFPTTQLTAIDTIFSRYNESSPGCAVGLYQYPNTIYSKGFGLANLETRTAIKETTKFDIASTSKQFTAASILLLAQKQKLSLDDDIRTYLTDFPDYGEVITIKHLLHHTSGLRDYIDLLGLAGFDIVDKVRAKTIYDMLKRQKSLNFLPGEQHVYSNSGYFLAGLIVEKISGKTLSEFAKKLLFKPNDMQETFFTNNYQAVIANRATGYAPESDDGWRVSVSNWDSAGAGGVFTTISDILNWERYFHKDNLEGAGFVESMMKTGQLKNGQDIPYAMGLVIGEHQGLPTAMHGGSWAGYRSEVIRVLNEKLSVAVFCNNQLSDATKHALDVIDIVLGKNATVDTAKHSSIAQAESTSFVVDPKLFDQYQGRYDFMEGQVISIFREGNNYFIENNGTGKLPFFALSENEFQFPQFDVKFSFKRGESGNVTSITWRWNNGYEMDLKKIQAIELTEDVLSEYEGRYFSPELQLIYELKVSDSELIGINPRFDDVILTPVATDTFLGSKWNLLKVSFANSQSGGKTFQLNLPRTKELVFYKQ